MNSPDLEDLLRWEGSGGTWEVVARGDGYVDLALCTCTGHERMARLRSTEPDLLEYVQAAPG